ncbi:hypothetical protein FNV43_RR02542 [Rhamnella rubrinervis]|uniref:Uncharacterized protein n=1 Tax=Rhamnella rubrinervis TaxID=2594499 RepID=A0A8K0MTB0_9ROSA|nr:hypothetical protein FNV43_RR02542 [Rhamnella rubrinervis]
MGEDFQISVFLSAFLVSELLDFDRYAAYFKDKEGCIPLQIAAHHGYCEIVLEIILWCPDCCELVNSEGISEDIPHCIVENSSLDGFLMNDKHEDHGVTLAATTINSHPRVDNMISKDQN